MSCRVSIYIYIAVLYINVYMFIYIYVYSRCIHAKYNHPLSGPLPSPTHWFKEVLCGFRFFSIKFRIITVMDMSDEVWHAVWSDNVTLHWLKGWEADPTANTTCQDDKEMRDHVVECGEGPSFRMAAHHWSATLICISSNADAPMMIITSVDAQPCFWHGASARN